MARVVRGKTIKPTPGCMASLLRQCSLQLVSYVMLRKLLRNEKQSLRKKRKLIKTVIVEPICFYVLDVLELGDCFYFFYWLLKFFMGALALPKTSWIRYGHTHRIWDRLTLTGSRAQLERRGGAAGVNPQVVRGSRVPC